MEELEETQAIDGCGNNPKRKVVRLESTCGALTQPPTVPTSLQSKGGSVSLSGSGGNSAEREMVYSELETSEGRHANDGAGHNLKHKVVRPESACGTMTPQRCDHEGQLLRGSQSASGSSYASAGRARVTSQTVTETPTVPESRMQSERPKSNNKQPRTLNFAHPQNSKPGC